MQRFAIPASPDDLLQGLPDGNISVEHATDVGELNADAVQEFADGGFTARGQVTLLFVV